MPTSITKNYDLKVKAAYYYYKKNMKLIEIAEKLGISRMTLNKLMKDLVNEGIVKIEILDKNSVLSMLDLEESVKERFSLKDIRIVQTSQYDSAYITSSIALEAANMVDSLITNGMKISITWGWTLELLVDYLKGNSYIRDIKVYTLLGATGIINMQMQPNNIAYSLLKKYNGIGRVMNAPFMCDTQEARDVVMADRNVASIIEESMDSDITLVGIGPTPNELGKTDEMRYNIEVIKELKQYNVCGDICSNFYDIYGNICDAPISRRFVREDINDIKKHKCVIGIAGGEHKVASILGALNGGYLDVLVTDKNTITSVMEMADKIGV